jgi:hypothetical protein
MRHRLLIVLSVSLGVVGVLRAQTPTCVDDGTHHDRQTVCRFR